MNIVDIAILVIIVVSALIGVFRGFIREVLSLASWVVAFYIAWRFAEFGASYLEPYIDQPPFRIVASFAGIFIVSLIAVSIISYLLYRIFSIAGISGVDRTLGLLFGVVRGVAIVGGLILAAVFMDFASQPWWDGSKLVMYFEPVVEFFLSLMPPDIRENFTTNTA